VCAKELTNAKGLSFVFVFGAVVTKLIVVVSGSALVHRTDPEAIHPLPIRNSPQAFLVPRDEPADTSRAFQKTRGFISIASGLCSGVIVDRIKRDLTA
jgi:hypothetical protein